MVDRNACRDTPRPRSKRPARIESRSRVENAVEGFHRQVLRSRGVPDNPHDPTVDFALRLTEHRLKGIQVTSGETLEEVTSHNWFTEAGGKGCRNYLSASGLSG